LGIVINGLFGLWFRELMRFRLTTTASVAARGSGWLEPVGRDILEGLANWIRGMIWLKVAPHGGLKQELQQ